MVVKECGGRFVWVFKKTSWNYDHPSEQLQEYIQTYLHQLHFHTFQPTSQPSWHLFIQSCIQASPSSSPSPSSSASSPPTETASTASSASRIFVVASYMCTYLAGATSGGILQLYTTLLTFREDCCCFLILHQQLDHHRTPTLPHTHHVIIIRCIIIRLMLEADVDNDGSDC